MRRAGKAELVANPIVSVVGVSLDQVGHAVLGTPAVEDLLARVVGVDDVGPSDVTEISTLLQLFSGFTDLTIKIIIFLCHSLSHMMAGAAGFSGQNFYTVNFI